MPGRAVRLFLLRIAGWLLTPLVLIAAAMLGATIGLALTPRLSPDAGLVVTAVCALSGAVAGMVWWTRLLREHPRFRQTLDLTEQGAPESALVERLIHPDDVPPPNGHP